MPTLAAVQSSCVFAFLTHLDRAIQRELAVLPTLEADHCSACRWLDEWCAPAAVKVQVACRLEVRHWAEREAHVLRLAALHQQRMVLAMAHETGEPTDAVSGGSGADQGQSKLPRLLPPVWMISSPDHERAGSTVTAQTGASARIGYKDRP